MNFADLTEIILKKKQMRVKIKNICQSPFVGYSIEILDRISFRTTIKEPLDHRPDKQK
jgi:hypothetical protein